MGRVGVLVVAIAAVACGKVTPIRSDGGDAGARDAGAGELGAADVGAELAAERPRPDAAAADSAPPSCAPATYAPGQCEIAPAPTYLGGHVCATCYADSSASSPVLNTICLQPDGKVCVDSCDRCAPP